MGLFGGKRAIWVKATSRNIAPAVDAVLKGELQDTVIVIEGGDLAEILAPADRCASARRRRSPCPAMPIPAAISATWSTTP